MHSPSRQQPHKYVDQLLGYPFPKCNIRKELILVAHRLKWRSADGNETSKWAFYRIS